MDRRKFIKRLGAAGAAPILLNGLPINALAANSPLMKMLAGSTSDRVLIFLQMHGGNDGLNTVIPIDQYSLYQSYRANIAIPDDGARQYNALNDELIPTDIQAEVALHTDMTAVKELYADRRAAVVNAVGYDNMNLSHFRSRDIWFMGGDSDERIPSGWMGRFLEQEYPGYPDNYPSTDMPDPLGLEIGNEVTLAFQQENNIPAGISLANPDAFYNLINGLGVDSPSMDNIDPSYYKDELEYLMKFEIKTNDYAERLKEVWDAGANSDSVTYPETYPFQAPIPYIKNQLAQQFRIIARLLSGGIKTRIFMTRIGGFDTHANQVEANDASQGRHAALLYHISETVKAFHDDLRAQGGGLEDRVITMTFSEFGRRVYSNESYGSDHGKAAPILLFGNGLKGGVYGNADLSDLDNGNLRHDIDYRQLYTTVLSDWLGSPDSSISDTGFGDYLSQKLDLFSDTTAVHDMADYKGRNKLNSCYPNPATSYTKIGYYLDDNAKVSLKLYSSSGQMIRELVSENQSAGNYEVDVNVAGLKPGNYIYRLDANDFRASRIMLVN